ncbi:MAG: LamG domain-containing protein [Flavobacteriaceae bacterium]|nr:LamG domain-containing protein [Flavobacteriaceae bacterium]
MKNKKLSLYGFLLSLSAVLTILSCAQRQPDVTDPPPADNSPKSATESRGMALSFDGDSDFVVIEDSPSLNMTNGFTISAWVYLRSYTEWASIVTKGTDDNNYTIHQTGEQGGSEEGRLRFTANSPDLPIYFESNTVIPLYEWHHITLSYDGAALTFYLDGVEDGSGTMTGPLKTNNEPLIIGADFPGGDEFWDGAIDEVKIWNVALKAGHIRTAMNGHATPKANVLAAYWRFDEGAGTAVTDRSSNGNNGILIGDTQFIIP